MQITPIQALELLGHIAALDWRPLARADYDAFCDAGDEARIAEVSDSRSAAILKILGERRQPDSGLLAIVGGDALQVEFHGCDSEGEPIDYSLPLAVIQY